MDGVEASVPSVVFRIPPPDPRLANFLSRLHGQFEKLRKLWDRKHHLVVKFYAQAILKLGPLQYGFEHNAYRPRLGSEPIPGHPS